MAEKVRIGILGASRIAQKAIIPALMRSNHAELGMIGTRTPDESYLRAQLPGITIGTYEDVLASDVDAIYISLPNSLHEEWALRAAKTGKHVWCEKPAALTYASAIRMIEAASHSGVRLMEGFMYRYHPQHARVREIISSGRIGAITGFDARIAYPMPETHNIRLNAELGGGIYLDALVYPINAARLILQSEPKRATCTMHIDPELHIDIKNELRLDFPDGITAVLSSEFTEDYRSTYRVVGTSGTIRMERAYAVPPDMAVRIFVEADGSQEEIQVAPFDHFLPMIDEFSTEISSDRKTRDYEGELLNQARVVEAGIRSHTENRTVDLCEFN